MSFDREPEHDPDHSFRRHRHTPFSLARDSLAIVGLGTVVYLLYRYVLVPVLVVLAP